MAELKPTRLAEGFQDYPGMWVAMKAGRVVEVRPTPDELVEVLARRGIEDATVMRVPSEHNKELVGLG